MGASSRVALAPSFFSMPIALVLLSVTMAGYFDLRWRRVPNWLVALTIALSLTWHGAHDGLAGVGVSFLSLLGATAALFPLFVLRGMGAGDVKFFGALGAAVTYRHAFGILVIALFVSAFMALLMVLRGRALRRTIRRIGVLLRSWLRGGHGAPPAVNIDDPAATLLPFTLAVAIATWVFVLGSRG